MIMNELEIEAMLSIRLYQRFFVFVILHDYDTGITKSVFVLEGYFLTINVVERSYPHRIADNRSCNASDTVSLKP